MKLTPGIIATFSTMFCIILQSIDQTTPTVTDFTSTNPLSIPQLPIGQQVFQIEPIGGTLPMHVANMASSTTDFAQIRRKNQAR